MTTAEAKKRIEKLKRAINRHRYNYHVLNKSSISESALDSLKHELKLLEDKYPKFITPDSPTQRVEGEPAKEFEKVQHVVPMLSIEDIFSIEELKNWEDYLIRLLKNKDFNYFCEVKADGLALALRYKNGVLEQAITRGNGQIGENVIKNAKTIESIPLRLEKSEIPRTLEVRGEVYIPKKQFEKFNTKIMRQGGHPYANPRNLAAGSLRQLNPKLAASRPLEFLAYDLLEQGADIKEHSQEHKILRSLGFKTDDTAKICRDVDEVVKYWEAISRRRESLPYQIDGIVISVNQNAKFTRLGVAGKSPRGIRAFKFSPRQAVTKIIDVKVHVGRTGAITPLAVMEPINIDGVMVRRATLHNFDEIERLDARIGDTVIVERAGDVIPKVVRVLKDLRLTGASKISVPRKCPRCNVLLERKPGEVILRCANKNCTSRNLENIYYFVSKSAFDIDGLGPKIVDKLIKNGFISDPADIFLLKKEDFLQLKGFKEKSSQNLISAIETAKEISLERFINALGILHIGEETAIDLARHFGSIEALRRASIDELKEVEGIGDVSSKEMHGWFRDKDNQNFIKKLLYLGIKIKTPRRAGTKLKGKTFVLTGTLEQFSRDEAENVLRQLGGDVSSYVSRDTDFVVAGAEPGSKYDNAKKLGVKIINEKEFLKMIK
jgi:DNA ligase (NAD+)